MMHMSQDEFRSFSRWELGSWVLGECPQFCNALHLFTVMSWCFNIVEGMGCNWEFKMMGIHGKHDKHSP